MMDATFELHGYKIISLAIEKNSSDTWILFLFKIVPKNRKSK